MAVEDWVNSVIRAIMCLIGIIGNNWLCITSLPKPNSQLRTNDLLFINLGVSNLLTNYLVDVFYIIQPGGFLAVGRVYCIFQLFLPKFSETSSILTTIFITLYWHQKLVGSLKRGGAPVLMDNLHFTAALLTGSWIFAFVVNIPHFFIILGQNENATTTQCIEKQQLQGYKVTYTILVNFFPLMGIVYASVQITVTLLRNEKRMRKMSTAVQNEGKTSVEKNGDKANGISTVTKSKSKPQGKSGSLLRAAKSVVVVAVFFFICWLVNLHVSFVSSVSESTLLHDLESFVGASYTCVIPYIYLYGIQKLTCSR
ncbi:uncharacterized protein ora5 [Clarias gariepinus]|uniref:alpha-1A adrenergic receptor-like n=1 Tax=Clarias gariepinus TaxID=13013 RepID=UPI00234C60AF|nr:alpha-1A adrenergic receptor-like [Clarias gariepinus]